MKKTLLKVLLGLMIPLSAFASNATPKEDTYPVVIIGGGIGAHTSAVYLGRANIPHVMLTGKSLGGAIAQSHSVQNWPGEMEITGSDLIDKVHKQAEANGTEFKDEEVIAVDLSKQPFTLTARDIYDPSKVRNLKAENLIIALGTTPNFLGVKGEQGKAGYWGNGVSNCAVCDGTLYKGKTVAVIGGGDAAIYEADYLSHLAKKVHIFLRKDAFKGVEEKRKNQVLSNPNTEVHYLTNVQEIKGDGQKVTHLVVKNEKSNNLKEYPVDGVFLAIGSKPNSELFQGKLDMDKAGYILLKDGQETSVKGVYAIGDITDPHFKQAISAAGDGSKAALQVERRIDGSKKDIAVSETIPTASATAIEITSISQFEKEIKETTTPILVDFYATWCGPCKQISPIFASAAKKHGGKIKFLKVNVDEFPELSHKYNIRAMPTLLVFKKGDIVDRKLGSVEIVQHIQGLDAKPN